MDWLIVCGVISLWHSTLSRWAMVSLCLTHNVCVIYGNPWNDRQTDTVKGTDSHVDHHHQHHYHHHEKHSWINLDDVHKISHRKHRCLFLSLFNSLCEGWSSLVGWLIENRILHTHRSRQVTVWWKAHTHAGEKANGDGLRKKVCVLFLNLSECSFVTRCLIQLSDYLCVCVCATIHLLLLLLKK